MKLHYMGKFSGNVEDIPHGEHKPNAVKFKEADDPKKLGIIANVWALLITLVCCLIYGVRLGMADMDFGMSLWAQWVIGFGLSMLCLFPHEFLHAICMKEDVYLYTNFKQGMLFVTGPEDMSKARFVLMSLCPNLVFGAIPFVLFLIWPNLAVLGALGALSIGMGAGDYYNVFHALTQMPRGARTYLYQFNSWWYLPEKEEKP